MADRGRVTVTDVGVLAALAHPVRLAILHLLLSVGDRTATECAELVDASPSACSYHLRHLERFGLVERAEPVRSGLTDGRTRRWRSVASGFDFGGLRITSPEHVAARAALLTTGIEQNARLARHYLAHVDDVSEDWRGAAAFSTYALLVTPDELRIVVDQIDAILRPLRGAARDDAPDDARPVHLSIDAFARTDL